MSRFYRGDDSDSDRSDAGSDAGSDDEKLAENKRGPSAKTREIFMDDARFGAPMSPYLSARAPLVHRICIRTCDTRVQLFSRIGCFGVSLAF
jgi:hypothetical protein